MKKVIVIFAAGLWACSAPEKADLLIYNAKIYTADSVFSVQEAMAISAGKIKATGKADALRHAFTFAHEEDLQGRTILPGLIDAHCHFTGYATDMWKCDLVGTRSFSEVIDRVSAYGRNAPMRWIYARGWDQNDWEQKEYPDNAELNRLFPDRPVFLKRIDGHAALVNQVALDLAGITGTTVVNGGSIERKNGKPTGLLIDNAMDLVDVIVPAIPDTLAAQYFDKAQQTCFALGLTQVQDLGVTERTAELVDQEQKKGRLKMKVYALLSDDSTYYDRWIKKGPLRTDKLTVGGFKLYADGALGSRGACLLHPYNDKPGWSGFLLRDVSYLRRVLAKLAPTAFQVNTHAIGDSANRVMLHLYGEALQPYRDKRWRIEHAQVVDPADFGLFRKYDVIPSVQPTHATSDMYWADKRVGKERMSGAYAYKSLLRERGILPLGTDFPVEDIDPLKTFYAAVVRRDRNWYPRDGFLPEQALSREEALRGMTIWASKAIFEEHKKGSLEAGKVADFVVLDTDIMTCDEKKILASRVLATYLDGEPVYRRN